MDPTIINPEALERLEEWGGADLVQKMVSLFLENSPERLEQIRAAFADDPGSLPERGSHSLKSSAANVGAVQVREVCALIEHASSEEDWARVRELVPQLESAYAEVVEALESTQQGNSE